MTEQPSSEPVETDKLRLDRGSLNIVDNKRRALLDLFPEARTEAGSIDFDRLRRALGDVVDTGKERFGLTWPGKAACFKAIQAPSMGTLLPLPSKSVDFETTGNVIIEGDNLEVLKLLQKSYLGKIKMIYIDPPYNTGNDFIYPDNYGESLETYLRYTGQIDDDGKRFSNNNDSDGRFHSKWLNMMYPRLYLARQLLRSDGLCFISIDDSEVHALRIVMNDLFGEENLVNVLCWVSNLKGRQISQGGAVKTYESILVYARNIEDVVAFNVKIDEAKRIMPSAYKGFDYAIETDEHGPYVVKNELYNTNSGFNEKTRNNLVFNIHYNFDTNEVRFSAPDSPEVFPGFDVIAPHANNDGIHRYHAWRWGKEKIKSDLSNLKFVRGNGKVKVFTKIRDHQTTALKDLITDISTSKGSAEIRSIFGAQVFEFPKPTDLLKLLINQTGGDDIILDFFAGSGTTGQAVLELNASENMHRKFIMVQLPEPTGRADYPTIADVAEERVRLISKKFRSGADEQLRVDSSKQDRGFRVFRLAESNVREWDSFASHDSENLRAQLALGVDHLRSDRNDLDVVYEVLIKSGYMLSETVTTESVAGSIVYAVSGGVYLICLERSLTLDLIRAIAEHKPERVLFLDEGFAGNDQLKSNAVQTFKDKNVVFRTL